MIGDIPVPNDVLLDVIISKIKEGSLNLVQIHKNRMSIKLNKMNQYDWGFDEVYHIEGDDIEEMLGLMKVNPNVIYVENSNVNDGIRNIDILGKLVVHNPN